MMKIRVLFFGALAQRVKAREVELEVPPGALVSDVILILEGRYAELANWRGKLAYAVNMAYVKPGHRLSDNDELGLVPPVSGG